MQNNNNKNSITTAFSPFPGYLSRYLYKYITLHDEVEIRVLKMSLAMLREGWLRHSQWDGNSTVGISGYTS